MLAIDLEQAKRIAIGIVVGLAVLAFLSAWLVKTVVTKILTVVLIAALAFAVWTQRSALQDCADRVKAESAVDGRQDTTCSFFGFDVTIPDVDVPDVPGTDSTP